MGPKPSNLGPETLRKIRHELSAGLSFVETSVHNLSGKKPDPQKALKLYDIGSSKLRAIISDLDSQTAQMKSSTDSLNEIQSLEMLRWEKEIRSRSAAAQVFGVYREKAGKPTRERALAVATAWFEFAETLHWFFCQSAALLARNENRRHFIQAALEKFDIWSGNQTYSELFWETAKDAGISEADRNEARRLMGEHDVIQELRAAILKMDRDPELLGLLLSFEILNDENIDAVFQALAWNNELESQLGKHQFFRQHRNLRHEQIQFTLRHVVETFRTEAERNLCMKGFDRGIGFWADFWRSTGALVERLESRAT